ncbi:MAG: FHA domain-containing protein [Acidobacteria bacterium]|nr:FHA domain-containing protein [Acidobacteriota bacterium]
MPEPPAFSAPVGMPKTAPPYSANMPSNPSRPSITSSDPSMMPPPNNPAPTPQASPPASFAKGTNRAKLIIQRGGTIGKEFMLTDSESNIGRWDADGGIFPDVDLDQDDPEAKVSRRHARIIHQSGQYLIEDLGSTNGTFINRGRRLLPGNRHPLNNGDEIIVGKTFLKFVVE